MKFLILLASILLVFANGNPEHNNAIYVTAGKSHTITINMNNVNVKYVTLYYRTNFSDDFQAVQMKKLGFDFQADVLIPSKNYSELEYYFSYMDQFGFNKSNPESNPEINPYRSRIVDFRQDVDLDYQIISPLENETLLPEDFLIVLSFFEIPQNIDLKKTVLVIDGATISNLEIENDVITYIPPDELSQGAHNLEIQIFDNANNLAKTIAWSISVSSETADSGAPPVLSMHGRLAVNGISEKLQFTDRNYSNFSGDLYGNLALFQYKVRSLITSQDNDTLQAANRIGAELKLPLWGENAYLLAGAGDYTPEINPYILSSLNVRGFSGAVHFGFLNFDFSAGKLRRQIISTGPNSSYDRTLTAGRLSFGGNHSGLEWGFNFMRAKDEDFANSVNLMSVDPQDNLVIGTDIALRMLNRRLIIKFGGSASVLMSNTRGGDLPYSTLSEKFNIDISESTYDLAKKFITLSGIPSIGYSYFGEVSLNAFSNYLKVKYVTVSGAYQSFGMPYLQKGYQKISVYDNLRLFESQIYLNVNADLNKYNVDSDTSDPTEANRINFGFTYYPTNDFPSLSLRYGTFDQSTLVNDSTLASTNTNMIRAEISKGFNLLTFKNMVVFGYGTSTKDDANNTVSNNLSASVQTDIGFLPLIGKLQYSSYESGNDIIGTNVTNDILLRADFQASDLMATTQTLKFYAQYGLSNTENVKVGNEINLDHNYLEIGANHVLPIGLTSLNSNIKFRTTSYSGTIATIEQPSYSNSLLSYSVEYRF
ncbi:MAG: hypothetical protein KDD94_06900 [Calditrichaeota bacterium]|nr:hypothetical protein [Calditrichota bacterium]